MLYIVRETICNHNGILLKRRRKSLFLHKPWKFAAASNFGRYGRRRQILISQRRWCRAAVGRDRPAADSQAASDVRVRWRKGHWRRWSERRRWKTGGGRDGAKWPWAAFARRESHQEGGGGQPAASAETEGTNRQVRNWTFFLN